MTDNWNLNWTVQPIDTDAYLQHAYSIVYDDYRFMFMASCLALLCAIEIGKSLKGCTSVTSFLKDAWTFSAYLVSYLVYGMWSLFHVANRINGM